MQDKDTLHKIKRQIEYYMGDANLKNDKFFNEMLRSSEDGLLEIKVLQNCGRIKQYEVDDEVLLEAVKLSDKLRIVDGKFGRKNKYIPPLRDTRIVITFDDYELTEEEKLLGDKFKVFKPMMIHMECEKSLYFRDREFLKLLYKQHNLESPFAKVTGKRALVIINQNSTNKD